MNSRVLPLRIASVAFGLICIGHLVRLWTEIEVVIGGRHLPLWTSGVAAIVTAALCAWTWISSLTTSPATPPSSQGGQNLPSAAAS
jgi:hypothetical protein